MVAFSLIGGNLAMSVRIRSSLLLAAGAALVAMPIVIVFILFQRSFIRGMVAGAIK